MSTPYVSSITTKYGDLERVREDVKTLNDILARQGSSLLIDVIAEQVGNTANKFNFRNDERAMTMIALVDELENAIKERI
jgi:hypothetical protein